MVVEPNPQFLNAWQKYRSRDLLLNVAVSPSVDGYLYYHSHYTKPGLNFVADEPSTNPEFRADRIECVSVASLVDRYVEKFIKLDAMSIDCEGLDFEILRAFPFNKVRPKTIVIEDFDPTADSPIERYMEQQHYKRWAQLRISKIFFDSLSDIKV